MNGFTTVAMNLVGVRWVTLFMKMILQIRKFSRGLYFRETSHMRKFAKIKPSQNDKITLSFIDIGKSCLSREFFHITNMYFNAIRENNILAKIYEFTVHVLWRPAKTQTKKEEGKDQELIRSSTTADPGHDMGK